MSVLTVQNDIATNGTQQMTSNDMTEESLSHQTNNDDHASDIECAAAVRSKRKQQMTERDAAVEFSEVRFFN
jgi:hypothetical protein